MRDSAGHHIIVTHPAVAQWVERRNDFLNKRPIHPVIDKIYPFKQAREAYEHLARRAFGKIAIKAGAFSSVSRKG